MAAKKTVKKSTRKTAKKATKVAKTTKRTAKKTVRKTTKKATPVVKKSAPAAVKAPVPTPIKSTGVSKGVAWLSLFLNILIFPGLGTLVIKNFSEGIIQVALAVISFFLLNTTGDFNLFLVIVIIAGLWSVLSSIQAISKAK